MTNIAIDPINVLLWAMLFAVLYVYIQANSDEDDDDDLG